MAISVTTRGTKAKTRDGVAEAIYDANWHAWSGRGNVTGPPDSPLRIVEFVDGQCPYCARFQRIVDSLRAGEQASVSVEFMHLPIASHAYAADGARALECAAKQERFDSLVHQLFARQDSLGRIPWMSFAVAAGVKDTVAFVQCLRDAPAVRIEQHRALADSLEVKATPTVFVNGWRYAKPPTLLELRRDLVEAKAGRELFTKKRQWWHF